MINTVVFASLAIALPTQVEFPAEHVVPSMEVVGRKSLFDTSKVTFEDRLFSLTGEGRVFRHYNIVRAVALLAPTNSIPDYVARHSPAPIVVYDNVASTRAFGAFENTPATRRMFGGNEITATASIEVFISEGELAQQQYIEQRSAIEGMPPTLERFEHGRTVLTSRWPILGLRSYTIQDGSAVMSAQAGHYPVSDWHIKWMAWSALLRKRLSPVWENGASMVEIEIVPGKWARVLPFVGDRYVAGKGLTSAGLSCMLEDRGGMPWLRIARGNAWIAFGSLQAKAKSTSGDVALATPAFAYDGDLWVPVRALQASLGLAQ